MEESRRKSWKKARTLFFAGALCFGMLLLGGCSFGTSGNDAEADTPKENQTASNGKESGGSLFDFLDIFKGKDSADEKAVSDEDFLEKANYLKSVIDVYFWEETNEADLYEGMYKGLLDSLGDPYSCYYTKEEYAELMESVEGVYCGIGAMVSQDVTTNAITIVRPFVDGPAYKAGMLPGDILTHIDGEDVAEWDINLAVKRMKGEQGTEVDVTVWRASEGKYVDMTVIRDLIEVETVTYEMLDDEIGYIYIMEFDEITLQQFETALNALKAQGMKGLVVDLRDNPGGLLDTVCDMLDMFIEEGLIVYTMDKYEDRDEVKAKKGSIGELPMAILVNGNSASASEIFAGAMQDYELATIVGTQSFGKGIVQSILPLRDGSAVKLTVSTYYTPLGRSIHGEGVTPDVVVELDEELLTQVVIPLDKDNQVQAAIEEVKKLMK